jgi:hypothetical protein
MGRFGYLQSRVKRKAVVAAEEFALYQMPADAKPEVRLNAALLSFTYEKLLTFHASFGTHLLDAPYAN